MSNPLLQDLFKSHLLKEAEGDEVFRDRETDFPDDSDDDFNKGLDGETIEGEFDTEGLGFDPNEQQTKNFTNVYNKVDKISDMITDLIDPKNNENLTRQLAIFDTKDSVASGLLQKLEKPILKASNSLAEVKNLLDQVSSMEPSLKRKLEALESK